MFSWLRRNPRASIASQRYVDIVTASRNPVLFNELSVPDTLDGRFEAIVLHGWLVLRRLKRIDAAGDLRQQLFDLFFQDMDQNLREMGVSDLVVGDRVKAMAKAFYGRVAAYEEGVEQGDDAFAAALRRNLYGTAVPTEACLAVLTAYLRGCDASLRGMDDERMLSAQPLDWPVLAASG